MTPGLRYAVPDAWIKQRLQAAFDEVEVGGADSGLLRERLFKLASLELEFGPDSDVEIDVANDRAGRGVGISQQREVEVRTVVALEAEAGAPDQERVRRCAVTLVGAVVGVDVAVRADAELSVRAPDEEMLAVPSRRHVSSQRPSWAPQRVAPEVSQHGTRFDQIGSSPPTAGAIPPSWRLRRGLHMRRTGSRRLRLVVGQFCTIAFSSSIVLRCAATSLRSSFDLLLACARGCRCAGFAGWFLGLSQRT